MNVQIIFSTERGYTGAAAAMIQNLLIQKNINSSIKPINQIVEIDPEIPLIYLTSTFFDGLHPRIAQKAFEELQGNRILQNQLRGLKFCIFAIGSTAFRQFCKAGELAENEFKSYGAIKMMETVKFDRKGSIQILDCCGEFVESFLGLDRD